MTRQRLTRDIQHLDQQLNAQNLAIQRCRAQTVLAFRQTNPLWFVGLGFLSGVLVRRFGLHNVYRIGLISFKGASLAQTITRQLMSSREL